MLGCVVRAEAAVTVRSGDWTNPATWGGSLPRPNDAAEIAAAHTVTFDASAAEVAELTVRGTLRIARDRSTRLVVRCNVLVYGVLDTGRPGDHIPSNVTHDLVFRLTQARAAAFVGGPNLARSDCGLWVLGRWDAHGAPLVRAWGKLAGDVSSGETQVRVAGDVSDWPIGGQVVVTHTGSGQIYAPPAGASPQNVTRARPSESEYVTIAGVEGSTVTLASPLRFAHSGSGEMRGEVGLISRNVTISTELENAGDVTGDVRTRKFAHVMFMPTAHGDGTHVTHGGGGQGNLEYIAFRWMGHYGKDGRYALHYHRLGDGARGMIARGLSWFESGFRCTNRHESNGMLIEDTVCVNPGGGAAHMVQTDTPSQQADGVSVHNLVVGQVGVHFSDRNRLNFPGERLRAASAFWPGTSEHEAFLGDVSVGPAPDGDQATGFHWPEDTTSPNGTIARIVAAAEAHGHTFAGFHSWQNRGRDGHDLVGIKSWGNSEGFVHGAYSFDLYIYNALFARSRIGYLRDVTFGHLQDSTILGRGPDAVRLANDGGDRGVVFNNYAVQPNPWKGARYIRNRFDEFTPGSFGEPGTAIWRGSGACGNPNDERNWSARVCSSSFPRVAENTFGDGVRPYRFGWSDGPRPFWPNINSFWLDYDRQVVLVRKDQKKPQGQFTPMLVNAATFYDPAADALATPFGSLPETITFANLLSYRDRPYADFTLDFKYDPPPRVSLQVQLTGSQLMMTADASPDTQRVEFWVDWVHVATVTVPPFTTTVDLDNLAAHGDILPPRKFAYAYARAFDGVVINAGSGEGNTIDPGYEQRAYSAVEELTPEARLGFAGPVGDAGPGPEPPTDPEMPDPDFGLPYVVGPSGNARSAPASALVSTADQMHLTLTRVSVGVNEPSDIAFAPDGTIFIAERGGRVRVIEDNVLLQSPALDLARDLGAEGKLLSIALDRQFAETRAMYALYAGNSPRGGQEFVLARFRYSNGRFGDRAVLFDRVPAPSSAASGSLGVGPDGRLYIAVDSSADPHLAGSYSAYNGKVLRLNTDGTTPDDHPQPAPIFSLGHPKPQAIDWQPGTAHLWIVDGTAGDGQRLAVLTSESRQQAGLRKWYALPAGTGTSSSAFYRGDLMPAFKGNLFLAAEAGRHLLRLRFDPGDPSRIVAIERLLRDEIGAVRAVAEGPDGGLYVASDSALYRLAP
jgi:glucose/arabinose dehydrogenase